MKDTDPRSIASVEVTLLPHFAVAALGGRLGEPYAGAIRELLRAIVLGGRSFVLVDFAAVTEVDSRGLGTIISLLKLARERGGEIRCCGAPPHVAEVFAITRLDRILAFYPNQAAGLAEPWPRSSQIQ